MSILNTRYVARLLLVMAASFCFGLLVFYVPERRYRAVPEVWLPTAQADNRPAELELPVKTLAGWQRGIRFLPMHPGGPETIVVEAADRTLKAASCPNLYDTREASPSDCIRAGNADGADVYVIKRQAPSHNLQAYTERGHVLVAVTGVYSKEEAVRYLRGFDKVARRDVDARLAANRQLAKAASEAIRQEKAAAASKRATAYKRVPYEPALPAILPAGWIQHSVRIGGKDAKVPTEVEVRYKKGKERFITMTMLPKEAVTLGATCGPTPGAGNSFLPCSKASGEDYYLGGLNEPDRIALYLYRPIGDIVAVLRTSVHSDGGQPLLFAEHVLETQRAIAKSLKPAEKSRLEGAVFAGSYYDPYPNIKL